ncbi:hypothetical protein PHYBLDRAFT_58372 [Phycomyces blakesleeanus NRRL 1555(-)]|uniref:Uncharacterized protein n=1 Tax=Phycomyces blakesleeanus (strain ATCC 8743b / DSM 1359 / FGSC 10004 / NBRC 33097 / NRRL 1555) TaxID=763407 RepID=A0A162V193_PHYB8|nr:hypothetical protein PHYBLDRAFT_58372 [Phycomyces blakesleeanus NRRL 1555(-)]OAD79322.1 hypothetical protein PHYBLDRAFT_58372 [Phycomyces blakesleeanus NRRL 1555(-)]|eukprot:XP_018297362.1 hypothetical protein PHYBLDRAFT_58372 [Phycomyces blakesleeanus NRRL 1555(-)]
MNNLQVEYTHDFRKIYPLLPWKVPSIKSGTTTASMSLLVYFGCFLASHSYSCSSFSLRSRTPLSDYNIKDQDKDTIDSSRFPSLLDSTKIQRLTCDDLGLVVNTKK